MASHSAGVPSPMYRGEVEKRQDAGRKRSYYRYLIKSQQGELLFDGAAGDIQEANESIKAHLRFLNAHLLQ